MWLLYGCNPPGAISCLQGSTRVWEAISGREVARVTYSGEVYSVIFSLDGEYVVSGGEDTTTGRVWLYLPKYWISEVCVRFTRNLTRIEGINLSIMLIPNERSV
jgi:hypothetical protein